jgi:natural resistance-associated macrophage protein 2
MEGPSESTASTFLTLRDDKGFSWSGNILDDTRETQTNSDNNHEEYNDNNGISLPTHWSPSGIGWKDCFHFVGPGWLISIAYVDPGNYQADIQAGSTSKYSLLFVLWWTSLLSIYVQILCVRLAYYGNMTLAEAQAKTCASHSMRYVSWAIAEFSTVITDLPEVIGFGIACHIFFGWPYYIGVIMSLLTTMTFLATRNCGIRLLEVIIVFFVSIMSISLFVELGVVKPNTRDLIHGWTIGFVNLTKDDIFAMTGVVGSVVMPHNLYLHSASCLYSRPVEKSFQKEAVRWSSLEPVFPILTSFAINLSLVAIAAERASGLPADVADKVGLTNFCSYLSKLPGGCWLWAMALLAAGQSSAITTTYTGQYVMDGFLNLSIPIKWRAIVTRLVAILPCIIVSAAFPNHMNDIVNLVNSSLSVLLPFAFIPLVKLNCSSVIMGEEHYAKGFERIFLYSFALAVWIINATALSIQGGGFFGDWRQSLAGKPLAKILVLALEVTIQIFYAGWMWRYLFLPIRIHNLHEPMETSDRINPIDEQSLSDNEQERELI